MSRNVSMLKANWKYKLYSFLLDFAKDQYGQNNEVVLKSLDDERTFPCDPFKQDSDTEQLVCYQVR